MILLKSVLVDYGESGSFGIDYERGTRRRGDEGRSMFDRKQQEHHT